MISNPENQPLLGNYRLLRYLGGGGFADVYLGEHIHLERQAVLNVNEKCVLARITVAASAYSVSSPPSPWSLREAVLAR